MKTLPGITGLEYCTKGIGVQTRDPIIQSPGYSQSYNGYSYCFNNPLKFADPFGFTAVATALDMAIELWNQTGEYGGYYGPSGPVSYSKTEAETLFWAFEYLANEIGIPYWRFGYRAYLSGFVSDSQGGTGFVLSLYNLPDLNWSFQINPKSNYYFILDPWDNYYSHQKATGQGGNSLYAIGVGINAAGFVSSAGEYSNVINGSWRGVNGKWNSLEWGGNQWTGARANALSKAGYFKLASRGLFVVGTGISLYQGGDALLKGDYAGAAKSGLDIGMGAFATFGGPPGWIIGGGYFALDALGAFDRPMITTPYSPPMYAVPDNTYVAPRVIFPLR